MHGWACLTARSPIKVSGAPWNLRVTSCGLAAGLGPKWRRGDVMIILNGAFVRQSNLCFISVIDTAQHNLHAHGTHS